MKVKAHHLDKNNGLLTSHQNSCNFCTETFVLQRSLYWFFVLFIVILISLSALRLSFLRAIFFIKYFAAFHQIDRIYLFYCFSLQLIVRLIVILIVDCGLWSIAFKNKDSYKLSTLVCYSSISIVKQPPNTSLTASWSDTPWSLRNQICFGRRKR